VLLKRLEKRQQTAPQHPLKLERVSHANAQRKRGRRQLNHKRYEEHKERKGELE
jgi:hypothetical protein